MTKVTWGRTAEEYKGQVAYSKGRAGKIQRSLDLLFGKRPDCYGQWKTIENAKRKAVFMRGIR